MPNQQLVLRFEESFEEVFNDRLRDVIAAELGDMNGEGYVKKEA